MEPNQDKNPEKRSVRFIEGKGFYIALVLCAAVIGVSAWSLLADTKTMDDERAHSAVLEVVPTPVVPVPETPQPTPELSPGAGNSGGGSCRNGGAGCVPLAGRWRGDARLCDDGTGL